MPNNWLKEGLHHIHVLILNNNTLILLAWDLSLDYYLKHEFPDSFLDYIRLQTMSKDVKQNILLV